MTTPGIGFWNAPMVPPFYQYAKYKRYFSVNVWFYTTGLVRMSIGKYQCANDDIIIIERKYESVEQAEKDMDAAFS